MPMSHHPQAGASQVYLQLPIVNMQASTNVTHHCYWQACRTFRPIVYGRHAAATGQDNSDQDRGTRHGEAIMAEQGPVKTAMICG